jgi:phosphoenolpyruvate carboxykinase (GTP)
MQSATDHTGKPLAKNQHLIKWVEEMARLTKPDTIVWCDGSY